MIIKKKASNINGNIKKGTYRVWIYNSTNKKFGLLTYRGFSDPIYNHSLFIELSNGDTEHFYINRTLSKL